jgi:cathepsin D
VPATCHSPLTCSGVDESRFTGEINYIPKLGGNANFTSHWAVPLDSISLKGKPLDFVKPGTPAILDTGATLLLGPEADVEKFYSSIPGADKDFLFSLLSGTTVYSIPCNTTSATFDLSFKIGGIDYPIHESDFYFLKAPLNTGGSFCIGSVMGSALDFWLLGDTFLKNVYSVYRLEPPSVGFAKLKKN